MPKGYLIDLAGIKRLREDHEMLLKRVINLEQKRGDKVGDGVRRNEEFAKVKTLIAPRDIANPALNKTLGTGKAELYKIIQDATTLTVTFEQMYNTDGSAIEVDVYNTSLVPVPVDAYVRITRNFRSGLWMIGAVQTAIAAVGSYGITGRSGTTAGTGEARIHYINGGVLTDTGETLEVYNLSASAIDADSYITIKRVSLDEDWIVDAEDCG